VKDHVSSYLIMYDVSRLVLLNPVMNPPKEPHSKYHGQNTRNTILSFKDPRRTFIQSCYIRYTKISRLPQSFALLCT